MIRIIALMMDDMKDIYPLFFMNEWYTANPPLMSSIVVTLKDYFNTELSPHMLTPAFQDIAHECAKRIAKVYVGHLLEKKHPPFTPATVLRMQKDIGELRAFFGDYIREKVLDDILQPLELLKQLLEASTQLIAGYYGTLTRARLVVLSASPESLLDHFPDASLNVIEVLLDNRQDLERAEVKDALAACQSVAARKNVRRPSGGAMLLGETSVKRKKKNKTKAFFTKLLQKF